MRTYKAESQSNPAFHLCWWPRTKVTFAFNARKHLCLVNADCQNWQFPQCSLHLFSGHPWYGGRDHAGLLLHGLKHSCNVLCPRLIQAQVRNVPVLANFLSLLLNWDQRFGLMCICRERTPVTTSGAHWSQVYQEWDVGSQMWILDYI